MKIEIGESLMYSWLRHVKGCQLVQNNWKVSPKWVLNNENKLKQFVNDVQKELCNRYDIFGKNTFIQFLEQGEADAVGFNPADNEYYAIDVAYHRGTLNYNGKQKTIAKVLEKCLRSALCFYGYLDIDTANIIFASPRIGESMLNDLIPAIDELQNISDRLGFHFKYLLYGNDDFTNSLVSPVIACGDDVNDTTELFLRAYQLLKLVKKTPGKCSNNSSTQSHQSAIYSQFKIGRLANIVLRSKLENGKFTKQEIDEFLDAGYSKTTFGLQYPLLTTNRNQTNEIRYYAAPLTIGSKEYYLCSQWFETKSNNDRQLLEAWLSMH